MGTDFVHPIPKTYLHFLFIYYILKLFTYELYFLIHILLSRTFAFSISLLSYDSPSYFIFISTHLVHVKAI